MSEPLEIEYYSDVLCVWAWIAERRNEELQSAFPQQIRLKNRFLDLFSDTGTRIGQGWASKGGYEGFGEHVIKAAAPYEDAPIHPQIWVQSKPATSANAHLVIKATQLACGDELATALARRVREAFFVDATDVGRLEVLFSLAEDLGIAPRLLEMEISEGRAIAALLGDTKSAQERRIQGSPSWLLNSGRQLLYGNVGYRVLQANVEELLRRPSHEASFC